MLLSTGDAALSHLILATITILPSVKWLVSGGHVTQSPGGLALEMVILVTILLCPSGRSLSWEWDR